MAGVDGITRADAEALFAEAVAPRVVQEATKRSVALATLPVLPMGTATERMPVLSALPTGAFLSADQAAKPLSEVAWGKKTLTAEEIAVIIPISETVIADSTIDVVGTVTDLIAQEFGRVIDAAVFFGTGAPSTFPVGGLFAAATGDQVVEATGVPATDLNALFGALEAAGFDPSDVYAGRGMKAALRGQTGVGGAPIYNPADGAGQFGSIYGVPLAYPLGWDKTAADAIVVDDSAVVIGLRQDLTIKILSEATLTGFGNLAEKDSIAVRAVMRVGFAIANPVTLDKGGQAYPVAALTPKPAAP
jgi:HK97 family phage major capsid protein